MGGIEEIIASAQRPEHVAFHVGDVLCKVRAPQSAQELISIEKIVAGHIRAIDRGNATDECKKYLPQSKDVVRLAGWGAYLSVEPKFDLAGMLRLSKEAGSWFLQYSGKLMSAIGMVAEDAAEEDVASEGEGSNVADGSPSGPSSPEMSTDSLSKS